MDSVAVCSAQGGNLCRDSRFVYLVEQARSLKASPGVLPVRLPSDMNTGTEYKSTRSADLLPGSRRRPTTVQAFGAVFAGERSGRTAYIMAEWSHVRALFSPIGICDPTPNSPTSEEGSIEDSRPSHALLQRDARAILHSSHSSSLSRSGVGGPKLVLRRASSSSRRSSGWTLTNKIV